MFRVAVSMVVSGAFGNERGHGLGWGYLYSIAIGSSSDGDPIRIGDKKRQVGALAE